MFTTEQIKALEDRGIDTATASAHGWKSASSKKGGDRWIEIPFIKNGEIVNRKYRTIIGEKSFSQDKGGEQCFYNFDILSTVSENEPIVIAEGECFKDADVLTRDGWVSLADWTGQDVLQVYPGGAGEFVKPIAKIEKQFDGRLIRHESRGWVSETTPGHNLVAFNPNGVWRKHPADTIPSANYKLPRVAVVNGHGIQLTDDQIKLCIAISADASIDTRSTGVRYVRFGLKRKRKIDRLRQLLILLGLSASDNQIADGYHSICFHIPAWVPGRMLPWSWISMATVSQREMILDELIHWDGNHVPNRTMKEYSSKYLLNAQWVQTLAHTAGKRSSIINRSNPYGKWFKTTILHGSISTSWQSVKTKTIPYSGVVRCLSVPSGMILVRQEGKITVTGNCDAMIAIQSGYSAVSVPNGAPSKPIEDMTTDKYKYLDALPAKNPIIIATDADQPGEYLRQDLVKRIGYHRCLWVQYPVGCKDLNDAFIKYGRKGVDEVFKRAKYFPLSGIFKLSDIPSPAKFDALPSKLDGMDEYFRMRPGDFTVITGIPGMGKTTIVNEITCNMAKFHNWKICFAGFDQRTKPDHLAMLRTYFLGKPSYLLPEDHADIQAADQWVENYFTFLLPPIEDNEIVDIEWCLERAARAVVEHDCKLIVIDPWNEMDHIREKGMSLTEYTGYAIKRIKKFAVKYQVHIIVVAHPAKMQRNKDGVYDIPSLYDISDSSHWYNKPDIGMTIHRTEDGLTLVRIQKCRYIGTIGKPGDVYMKYDSYRACYQFVDMALEPAKKEKQTIKNKLPPKEKKYTVEEDNEKIAAMERDLS